MRILILSQYFAPEPIFKATELADALARRGHEVVALTGFPNYPSGRLADGYRLALWRRESRGEPGARVSIVRTFEYPYHGRRAIGRVLNYVSFMLSASIAGLALGRFDAIYVWHPPLTVGVAAWLVGLATRAPFVYDVQDIWPEVAVVSGLLKDGLVVRTLLRMERFVYARAAHLLVVTEGARENLLRKGVPADRLSIGANWIEDEACRDVPVETRERVRAARGWRARFVVLFAGNLGLVQGLDTVLHAARLLRDEDRKTPRVETMRAGASRAEMSRGEMSRGEIWGGDVSGRETMREGGSRGEMSRGDTMRRDDAPIQIVFVGDGADRDRLQAFANDLGVASHVSFIDRQPPEAMPELMAAADALLVHLKRSELLRHTIPTKTLSYLAAGRPIVMAMEGAAADLVRQTGAGVLVPSEDPAALAQALRELRAAPVELRCAMGARGRAYARAHLIKSQVVPQYETLLTSLARTRQRGRAPRGTPP